MKIHEYQAKQILKKYNIPIQDGLVVDNDNDINETIKNVQKIFNSEDLIIKAQIHAGGRGKGGGIKYCKSYDDAVTHANNILGMQLITKQTGENGKEVKKIMITEALDINEEYYIALTLDRKKKQIVIMASSEGGMDIEDVAEKTPEKIKKIWINPIKGIEDKQIYSLIPMSVTRVPTRSSFPTAVPQLVLQRLLPAQQPLFLLSCPHLRLLSVRQVDHRQQ